LRFPTWSRMRPTGCWPGPGRCPAPAGRPCMWTQAGSCCPPCSGWCCCSLPPGGCRRPTGGGGPAGRGRGGRGADLPYRAAGPTVRSGSRASRAGRAGSPGGSRRGGARAAGPAGRRGSRLGRRGGVHAGGRILQAASSGRWCCGRIQRPARLLHQRSPAARVTTQLQEAALRMPSTSLSCPVGTRRGPRSGGHGARSGRRPAPPSGPSSSRRRASRPTAWARGHGPAPAPPGTAAGG
jgi:hypothetical protein